MDYRNLLGLSAVIFSIAVLHYAMFSANAGPMGPNVGTGSNPIENFSLKCTNTQQVLVSADSSRDFIVTDVITGNDNTGYDPQPVTLTFNSGVSMAVSILQSHRFVTGLKVPVGESLDCQNATSTSYYHYNVTILGYYAHP
jgi:hypothetical protein